VTYFDDGDVRLYCADALTALRELPDQSVHMACTSPPFFGLRDYQSDGQIGLESFPDEWAARLVDVFREVRRVLRDDGTLWVECGDSYAGGGIGGGPPGMNLVGTGDFRAEQRSTTRAVGTKPKDLIGQPWLLAFALRADGWYLRSCIIWAKPNCMPESVTDRPTTSHSYVFLLSKKPRYFYDAEALREPGQLRSFDNNRVKDYAGGTSAHVQPYSTGASGYGVHENGKNARSVWNISTEPNALAICRVCNAFWQGGAPREHCSQPVVQHFAAFPRELVRRMILAGSAEGDTVLDPFAGSGTTGLVARQQGRNAILIELNERYAAMCKARMSQLSLLA
jgi:DNA modification methylase